MWRILKRLLWMDNAKVISPKKFILLYNNQNKEKGYVKIFQPTRIIWPDKVRCCEKLWSPNYPFRTVVAIIFSTFTQKRLCYIYMYIVIRYLQQINIRFDSYLEHLEEVEFKKNIKQNTLDWRINRKIY